MADQILKGAIKVIYSNNLYVIHPETEVAEIVDYDESVATKLADNFITGVASSFTGSKVYAKGTVLYETDTGIFKVADGSTAYTNLKKIIDKTFAANKLSGSLPTSGVTVPAAIVSGSLTSANIPGSRVYGNVAASQINGSLTAANIPGSRVYGNIAASQLNGSVPASGVTVPAAIVSGSLTGASIAGGKVIGGTIGASVAGASISGSITSAKIPGSNVYGNVAASQINGSLTAANIPGSRVYGNIAASQLNGSVPSSGVTVPAAAVSGELSNAKIDASNVVGLVTSPKAIRFGYKISKTDSNPATRVTYLYDAVGMTPAAMNFATGAFSYGTWTPDDIWFLKGNVPVMLKNDGTVDYYLYENDYTKKATDSTSSEATTTASDITNTAYEGNAMAVIPLCYVKRYEDDKYIYEIISNAKYDETYEAFAHTNGSGIIKNCFYYSMFDGSSISSKIRSLSGQTVSKRLNTVTQTNYAAANNPTTQKPGDGWYIHSWSQRELIRTLCVLLGKTTHVQAAFGTGNAQGSGDNDTTIETGTLNNKGRFFGSAYDTVNDQAVKVFHIENFWGNQWDRTAGLINDNGKCYVKMTPEGLGYRINDVDGMEFTGITFPTGGGKYIKEVTASKYGLIPTNVSGSATTYYPDGYWTNNEQLDYLHAGGGTRDATAISGAFTFHVNGTPARANWRDGCGLSFIAS